MTSKKTTRRALFSSVMALILCCAMLVGSTFAWFTDSVSSVNNVITAGNLDVKLSHKTESGYDEVENDEKLIKDALWEPGYVQVVNLMVENVGTLALKYQLQVSVISETGSINKDGNEFKLSDYIQFGLLTSEFTGTREEAVAAAQTNAVKLNGLDWTQPGDMKAGDPAEYITLVIWMPETVGNEANHKTGEKAPEITLGINLFATQLEAESDSFGNDYDAEAGGQYYYAFYDFNDEADLVVFDPARFNSSNTAGTGLSIVDGKAVVNDKGAFYFREVDLTQHKYTVEYDVDVTNLNVGESVIFNTGDTATWSANTPVTITSGSVTIGGDQNVEKSFQGTKFHVIHVYALNADGVWVTTTTVTDGTDSITNTKKQQNYPGTGNNIFWDIEGVTAPGKVTLDNFTVSADYVENEDTDDSTVVEVTPENIESVDWTQNNAVYEFVGAFTDIVVSGLSGKEQVFDGSKATVSGMVKIGCPGVPGAYSEMSGKPQSGKYTIQNFTAKSVLVAAMNTSVTISGNTAEFISVEGGNLTLAIDGNEVDANGTAHSTYQNGNNEYGVYLYITDYTLSFTNNTITDAVSHAIGIFGRQSESNGFDTAGTGNTITAFSGNTITVNSATKSGRAMLKIWADGKYAPQADHATLNDAAKSLVTMVKNGGNNITLSSTGAVYFDFYDVTVGTL